MTEEAEVAMLAAKTMLEELKECTPEEIEIIEEYIGDFMSYDTAADKLTVLAENM
jgi:hypothetical protein